MAHIDPKARALAVAPTQQTYKRYELKIHEIKPEDIIPNGDRYVIEQIDFDESVQLGQLLVLTQSATRDPKDPASDPTVENRGVIVGVVLTVGNGHLLGLPDWAVPGNTQQVNGHTMVGVLRAPANVPMFFKPGDIVLVDHNAKGRALKMVGREIRIINQIDVLSHIKGTRLVRSASGEWEQEKA